MTDRPGEGRGGKYFPRKYVYCRGFGNDDLLFCHNNSKANLVRAIHERVFRVSGGSGLELPPRPSPGVFKASMSYTQECLRKHFIGHAYAPATDSQFLAGVTAAKKKIYERAVARYYSHGLHTNQCGVSAFVKFEKQVWDKDKPDPAPRVIQTRSPVYHYRLGRYTRVIEHDMYKALDSLFGGPTVMKGYNPDQVATHIATAWNSFNNPVGIPLDASRFDQHCSVDAIKWEHAQYRHLFPGDTELAWLLKQQEHNKGYGDYPGGQIRYTTVGCRMSGDMNTGLGNCLLMVCMMHAFCSQYKVTARLINNGDDCVLLVEREDLDFVNGHCAPWFLKMGYKMKLEGNIAHCIEQITFCQLRPVRTPTGYTMVRDLKCIVKDAASLQPNLDGIYAWMGAVGECGLALAGDIPVYGAIYAAYARVGKTGRVKNHNNFRNTGMAIASRGMNRAAHGPVADITRVSFYLAFGISPSQQVYVEERYNAIELGVDAQPYMLHHLPLGNTLGIF
jgi:hypothetical protein